MPELGAPELMIILLVVVLVFGGSRVAELGGSMGKGIKEFKKAMKDEDAGQTVAATSTALPVRAAGALTCSRCGNVNPANARLCNECGNALTVAGPVNAS